MKTIIYALSVIAIIASIAGTSFAFIKIDKGMRSMNKPAVNNDVVIYGHRVGPAGQEMLITTR